MNILKPKMEIKSIPFSRLLRLELPDLANKVISIVGSYKPAELQIEEIYNLLIAKEPQIKNLIKGYGASPITLQLKPLRDELMLHIGAIKFEYRKASLLRTDSNDKALTVVKTAIDLHLLKLRTSKHEFILNQKVTRFLHEVNVDLELMTALETLGFTEHIDELRMAHSAINHHLSERRKSIAQRPAEKTTTIANEVSEAIKDLFKQIEVAQLKHPELDYTSLFSELNVMISEYRTKISVREANAKRKTAQKKENQADGAIETQVRATTLEDSEGSDKVIETDQLTEPTTMVATTNGALAKDVVNSDEKMLNADFAESKDEKKTVASSSKQLQLPASNKEG